MNKSYKLSIILFFLLTFIKLSWALDCPEMNGVYSCPKSDGEKSLVEISQVDYEYFFVGNEALDRLIANGQKHDVPDGDFYSKTYYIASCNNGVLEGYFKAKLNKGILPIGHTKISFNARNDISNNLIISFNGYVKALGIKYPVDIQSSCVKKN